MTNPLAALIAGVPRYIRNGHDMVKSPDGPWLHQIEVLAALEAAPAPDLVEAEEYEAHLRREGDGLSVGAADTIRALIALATAQAAQIAKLEKERDDWKSGYKNVHKEFAASDIRKGQEIRELKARIAALEGSG